MASEPLSVPKQEPQQPPRQVNWRAQLARYVLVVDGQTKNSFADKAAAEAEAKRLKERWTALSVRIDDRGEPKP